MVKITAANPVPDKESYRKRRRENPQLNTINIEITCEIIHGEYNNPVLRYRRQVTKSQLIKLLTENPSLYLASESYGGVELRTIQVKDFNLIVEKWNKIKTKS